MTRLTSFPLFQALHVRANTYLLRPTLPKIYARLQPCLFRHGNDTSDDTVALLQDVDFAYSNDLHPRLSFSVATDLQSILIEGNSVTHPRLLQTTSVTTNEHEPFSSAIPKSILDSLSPKFGTVVPLQLAHSDGWLHTDHAFITSQIEEAIPDEAKLQNRKKIDPIKDWLRDNHGSPCPTDKELFEFSLAAGKTIHQVKICLIRIKDASALIENIALRKQLRKT